MNRAYGLIFAVFFLNSTFAATLDEEIRYLQIIEDFAGSICNDIEAKGEASKYTLQGEVSAELPTLFRKLVNAGADLKGLGETENYVGVPRESLPKLLSDNLTCKKEMTKILLQKMGPWTKVYSDESRKLGVEIAEQWNETQLAIYNMLLAGVAVNGRIAHVSGLSAAMQSLGCNMQAERWPGRSDCERIGSLRRSAIANQQGVELASRGLNSGVETKISHFSRLIQKAAYLDLADGDVLEIGLLFFLVDQKTDINAVRMELVNDEGMVVSELTKGKGEDWDDDKSVRFDFDLATPIKASDLSNYIIRLTNIEDSPDRKSWSHSWEFYFSVLARIGSGKEKVLLPYTIFGEKYELSDDLSIDIQL